MSKKFKIGIDYGGTKIEGILLDQSGKELDRKRLEYDKNYKSGINTIGNIVDYFKVKMQILYGSTKNLLKKIWKIF